MEFGEGERYACAALFTLALHMSQVPLFPFCEEISMLRHHLHPSQSPKKKSSFKSTSLSSDAPCRNFVTITWVPKDDEIAESCLYEPTYMQHSCPKEYFCGGKWHVTDCEGLCPLAPQSCTQHSAADGSQLGSR